MKNKKIKGYKGFNEDMTCRGMQYKEGEIYIMKEKPKVCRQGFHFCEYPLDCFNYYSPNSSKFYEVEALGDIDKDSDDTKVATNKLKVGAEVTIVGLVKASIEYTTERAKKVKGSTTRKKFGASSATGDCGASLTTGRSGKSTTENKTAIAVAWGYEGRARGVIGSYIACAEWKWDEEDCEWKFVQAKMVQVDGEKIKENTFYQLVDGEFVEVEDD